MKTFGYSGGLPEQLLAERAGHARRKQLLPHFHHLTRHQHSTPLALTSTSLDVPSSACSRAPPSKPCRPLISPLPRRTCTHCVTRTNTSPSCREPAASPPIGRGGSDGKIEPFGGGGSRRGGGRAWAGVEEWARRGRDGLLFAIPTREGKGGFSSPSLLLLPMP